MSTGYVDTGMRWREPADVPQGAPFPPLWPPASLRSVVLLLHGDGADQSTVFTDSSSFARVPSVQTGVVISAAQAKYGSTSIAIAGGGRLQYDTGSELALGTKTFSFESWVRLNGIGSRCFVCGQSDVTGANGSTSFYVARTVGDKMSAGAFSGSTQICNIVGSTTIAANQWYHVAFVRIGSTFTLYLDGASEGTASDASSINASVYDFSVGGLGEFSGDSLNGYVQDVRWMIGAAAYTAPFTPPSARLPDPV